MRHDDELARQRALAGAAQILAELEVQVFAPVHAAAQLARNGLRIGEPHRAAGSSWLMVELGLKNDWEQSLALLDDVLRPYRVQKSCGLARIVVCEDTAQWLEVMRRVSLLLAAGCLALDGGEAARRMG